MPPPGAYLSVDELLTALKWKLENEDDKSDAIEIGGPSDLARENWPSTWSLRMGELKHIAHLVAYHQNAVARVNCLPAEILSEIFLQVQVKYMNTSFRLPLEEPDLTGANEWIKVGHVCQKWRRTAQNTKALWSRIILGPSLPSPASIATHFFHQSHPLPISLEQDINQISDTEDTAMHKFYNLLLEHPNRVSALYLRGYFPETAWHLLQKALPNLVELELSFEKHRIRGGYIANFLDGSPSSSLRKLSLDNYIWPGLTPPALTHLYLTNEFRGAGLTDFFNMLALISPTLQALYLKEAGPASFNLEYYDSLAVAGRLVMPVLEHYEMLSCPFYFHANSLIHLYKLSLPNVRTIIWESQWTKDLNKYTDGHKRKAMIPPYEYRARVTRLVGWAAREKCYTLQGETLYFNPTEMTSSPLEMWVRLLPNLVMLAVPGYVKWDRMDDALIRTTTLVHLHVGHPSDDFIALVCILEKPSRFLPHLETLTVYYRRSLNDCLQHVNESFISTGLEPLSEPLINNSMTRTLDFLQATYTLRFDAGTIDGFFLTDPSS